MSLLADLLSKIKQPQTAREIPPNLKGIVLDSARRSANRRRIILLSVLITVAVLTGVFLVYFTRSLSERTTSDISIAPPQRPAVPSRQTPAETARPAEQKPVTQVHEAVPSKETVRPADTEPSRPVQKQNQRAAFSPVPNLAQVIVKKEAPSKGENESEIDKYLYAAREFEMKNDAQGALANYKKVLEIDTDNYTAMNNIAFIYLKMGLFEEAARYSDMALETRNDHVPALINRGIASAGSGDIAAAEAYLDRALKIKPDDRYILLNLAVLYERKSDYQKAVEYFSRLSASGDVSGTIGQARIYEKQGMNTEALDIYKRVYTDGSLDEKTRAEVKQRIVILSGRVRSPQF